MSDYWSAKTAAEGLADALKDLRKLAKEGEKYYSLPDYMEKDRDRAVRRVRDAVRFLCSPEADD